MIGFGINHFFGEQMESKQEVFIPRVRERFG